MLLPSLVLANKIKYKLTTRVSKFSCSSLILPGGRGVVRRSRNSEICIMGVSKRNVTTKRDITLTLRKYPKTDAE